MGYYMGDFYQRQSVRGVRGDPGFFSFLGGLAKTAAGFIPGVGPVASRGIEAASHLLGSGSALAKVGRGAISVAKRHPVMTAAGGAGLAGIGAGVGAGAIASRMGHPKALRMAGGGRHKRMRVTNPKALRRAIRRTQGFAKLAMRTIHLVHPKKKVRFGGFRKRRAKRAA